MKIKVGGLVLVSNYTSDQEKIITKGLSLVNPVYAVMQRQNNYRALYAVPQFIKYYKTTPSGIEVGRGVIGRLNKHFGETIDDVKINLFQPQICNPVKSNIVLRDYQKGVTEEILPNTEGIIRLDTAFGKSIIAMKLIEETQLKTLIVVPRLNLLGQFKSDIKDSLGFDCGIINGPTFDIKDITIATIQTLKKRDLSEIGSQFGMVIFDECHTYISDKGLKVIYSFSPLRLYGMTATADRSDGQGEAIKFTFGSIIADRKLPFEPPKVEICKCCEPVWGDTYPSIVDNQVENVARNKLIAYLAAKELGTGRKILILTKRTKHYDFIYELLPSAAKCYRIKSHLKKVEQDRQYDLLNRLRQGGTDFDVILGTFGLLSTGINIPALDTVIFAGDLKSSVLATQSVGRILRLFDGKKSPKIIDIDDSKSGILHNQARLRKKFYLSNEWEIL